MLNYKTVNVKDQNSCWKNFQGTDCEQETVTLVCWTYQSQQLLHEWNDDKLEATFDEVDANDHISQYHAIVLAHWTIIVDIYTMASLSSPT